jgi:GMP synthase-like glutamine amidotransferase
MTMQIAVIDPYIKSPAIHCFNGLVDLLQRPLSYFQPSQFDLTGLEQRRTQTCAYIVLGSASHVHENLPWHKPLASFLLQELRSNKPVLGCCFGHQLICHALGSELSYLQDEAFKLSGLREISITQDFWSFKQGESFTLGVTHKQVVKNLAPGLRAVGHGLENDIVIHEKLPFLGTQAHPEASWHFMAHDIQNLGEDQKLVARHHGEELISRFFKHFKLS